MESVLGGVERVRERYAADSTGGVVALVLVSVLLGSHYLANPVTAAGVALGVPFGLSLLAVGLVPSSRLVRWTGCVLVGLLAIGAAVVAGIDPSQDGVFAIAISLAILVMLAATIDARRRDDPPGHADP